MADAVVGVAVQKLVEFLIRETDNIQRARTDLEWLRIELVYMQCFIKDAETKKLSDPLMKQWLSDMKNIARDTVTLLDDFTFLNRPQPRCFSKNFLICCKRAQRGDLVEEVTFLKSRVLDISRKRETYGIRDINGGTEEPNNGPNNMSMMRALRRATSYLDEEELFVGFEDVLEILTNELLKEEPRRSILSIYGMGGLGKTTLARKMYNSANIKAKFPCRAWICVSQEYNTKDLLQSIIKSFRRRSSKEYLEKLEQMEEEDLESDLRQFLEDKTYLIVVDDIWHKEAWESLKRAFPQNKNGSRVIITTRKKEVAARVDDRSFIHELRFLRQDESWDLFCKKVYRREGNSKWFSPFMQDLGKEMLEKCGGLPLAIVVLGGLLSQKRGPGEWQRVKVNIWRHMKNDSVEISFLFSLSYDDLSAHLKKCLLYVGIFPEDHVISADKLMALWIAEELLPYGEERMEDIAEDCLTELIDRSLIQVADWYWGKIVGCRIHDLLRDLTVERASEVSFFDVYDPRVSSAPLACPRHAIHTQLDKYFRMLGRFQLSPQSLVFFNPDNERPRIEEFKSLCKRFKHLHILDLENVNFAGYYGYYRLPDIVGNLVHLKFFGLTGTNVTELPHTIGNLKSLQTIEALGCELQVPPEMCKLVNLRHILACCHGITKLGNLTNLQSLRYIEYSEWVKSDTSSLHNLRELGIKILNRPEWTSYSLESVGRLRSLTTFFLSCNPGEVLPPLEPLSSCQYLLKLRLQGKLENLHELENLPKSVTMLVLTQSMLEEDPMEVLGKMPNLRNLELEAAYDGKIMTCSKESFGQLEVLRFSHLQNLENWKSEEGSLPLVKVLSIYGCSNFKMVPERLMPFLVLRESNDKIAHKRYWPFRKMENVSQYRVHANQYASQSFSSF